MENNETVRIGHTATIHYAGLYGSMCNRWNTGKTVYKSTEPVTCKRCIKIAGQNHRTV